MPKFITPAEAASLVKDGDSVITEGFLVSNFPEATVAAIEERFKSSGSPRDLTLFYCAGVGDGTHSCVDHFANEGMLKRVIGGHFNLAPNLGKLIASDKVEAYNIPQGTIGQFYRDIAARKAGTITRTGLHTFIDPRLEGGKMNSVTKEDLVEVIHLGGEEQLFYKRINPNICFLRGTYADEKGNVTLQKEGVSVCVTSAAQAVKNNGGIVVVQVGKVVRAGTLDPRLVKIPGIYVDYVVELTERKNMWEIDSDEIDAHCGAIRVVIPLPPHQALNERKIICRRAALELTPHAIVNLGLGVPEMVSLVATEEKIGDSMMLTVEAGPIGGAPVSGRYFGVSVNPECILDEAYQFDFYDGGGIDLAFLGLAECDHEGNINVSKMNGRISGTGGFVNISQHCKKLFFLGTFTTKGLKIAIKDGRVAIEKEGQIRKFVNSVEQITFSGSYAAEIGQPVLYITERAVFELHKDGLHLTEVAPGIDIERDILAHMDFKPIINEPPKLMDARIFRDRPMGLQLQEKPAEFQTV